MKSITLTYNNQEYTLKFSRRTVKILESSGFDIDTAEKTPVTSAETLFAGAFLVAHERDIRKDKDLPAKIWAGIADKQAFFSKLIEMYNEPLQVMFAEPEEDEKNVEWTAGF